MPKKRATEDEQLFELEWSVCKAGYKIAYATAPIPKMVTKKYILGLDGERYHDEISPLTEGRVRKYNPFIEHPGLPKEFSCIPFDGDRKKLNEEAVLKFAGRYGLLGIHHPNEKYPESLDDWYEYVILFSQIYFLIKMGSSNHAQMLFNNFGPSPKFNVTICDAPIKRHRFLEIKPTNLLGAMWMMLANDIGKGCDLQSCQNPGCGIWFNRKSNKRFCSDACKMAWHRRSDV